MAYTKAGMKAVDKYVKENYARLNIKIPKAQREAVGVPENLPLRFVIHQVFRPFRSFVSPKQQSDGLPRASSFKQSKTASFRMRP